MFPSTRISSLVRVRGHDRVPVASLAAAFVLTGCGLVSTSPPAPTPADFQGITANFIRRQLTIKNVVSGDAGCDDQTLKQTAIGFDASGLDQAAPVRLRVYIFRNRASFERLRQTVDACAAAYAPDPKAFASVETSPYVVASAGPWAPLFQSAVRAAIIEAAGSGD
jgi:hypothetical protein